MMQYHRLLLLTLLAIVSACEEREYAKAYKIEHMSQAIGGPAAMGRPGDFLLENDRLRAVIHGRHNMRSTSPVGNGSLIDLDIQRPTEGYRVGEGKDAFYELGPMVNLKISSAATMDHGTCEDVRKRMHSSPCPKEQCVRVTSLGNGENIIGLLGLLDMFVKRSYDGKKLQILTDWDVCPGEPVVRVTTTVLESDTQEAKAKGKAAKVAQMKDLPDGTNLMTNLLGSGVMAGDLTFFSGKMNVFIPGNGFDHDGYIRSVFSQPKGNTFTNPLSASFVAGIGDGVSYAYFNDKGKARIPVFTEAFTAALTSFHECDKTNTDCLLGKELRFKRYVSVGHGDIASALDGFYDMRGIPTAKVEGNVVGRRSRKGVSGVSVFAFRVPTAWNGTDDYALAQRLKKEGLLGLMKQNRVESGTKIDPFGNPGIVTQFQSDVGLDEVKDGSIAGRLPVHKDWCQMSACRYVLGTMGGGREASAPVLVQARAGETVKPVIVAGDSSRLEYRVQNKGGQPLPAKITIGHCFPECATDRDCEAGKICDMTSTLVSDKRGLCFPKKGYTAGTCRPDQRWGTDPVTGKQTCICNETGLLPVTMGGHRYADGTVHVIRTHTGRGEARMEPGIYQAVVSRGFEYNIRRQFITLKPGGVARLTATLTRVVDTSGWISADFHVHGPNSPDAAAMFEPRVKTFVTEGVELLSSSDHDQLTDYRPTIYKLGMRSWLKSQVGVETSPVDYGHFLGFPLAINENAELNGAFHWKVSRTKDDPPLPSAIAGQDWRNLKPDEIFAKIRARGSLGPDKTVTVVAHFYDYFNYFYMEPWGKMETGKTGLWFFLTQFSPVLKHFSGEFDALEGFNGKNFALIRRLTYQEIGDYTANLNKLLAASADPKKWSFRRLMRHWGRVSAAAQREALRRTAAEQRAGLNFSDKSFDCRCTQHSDCASGVCDRTTGACGKVTCKDDSTCDATLVTAGREKCLPVTSAAATPATCQRVYKSCSSDSDCDQSWGKSGAKEKCMIVGSGASAKRCELPCTAATSCRKLDPMRPACDLSAGVCGTTELYPCRTVRGTVADGFQLLNRGVVRPFLGNSDTHGTYGTEAGIPRNYVKSSTDVPPAISIEEVAASVKSGKLFSTYGPFVQLSIDGKGMGQKVNAQKGKAVKLKLRVQSPLWFDVDRVEVYRNGLLIKVIEGKHDCKEGAADCIRSPNKAVVNYDGTITDTPKVDSWYVVAVMGLDGKTLAPVYSSSAVAPLGMYELMQRLVPMVPMGSAFATPLGPSMSIVRPYALTNPIWVDVGGDGLTALLPAPKWATEADRKAFKAPSGSTTSATSCSSGSTPGAAKSHSHDHSYGLGRMRRNAAASMSGVKPGQLSPEMIRQALQSLRYMH